MANTENSQNSWAFKLLWPILTSLCLGLAAWNVKENVNQGNRITGIEVNFKTSETLEQRVRENEKKLERLPPATLMDRVTRLEVQLENISQSLIKIEATLQRR